MRASLRALLFQLPGAAATLALLLTLVFFCLRAAPGGPFDSDRKLPPEVELAIQARYGLDLPLPKQFAQWVSDTLQGDLGESFQYLGRPVSEIIASALPPSIGLGLVAIAIAVALGVPAGVVAAARKDTALDRAMMAFANAGISLPSYVLASILILVFALKLRWLPPALWDEPGSWVLPAVTLAVRPLALVARLVRASMIEALRSDYVRTARAKGLREPRVLFKHALRNSLIPVLTLLGPLTASLVTGSFLVETVFQVPGLGRYFVTAVLNRDYPLVMGTTVVYGVLLLSANLAVDFFYALADPRIRVGGKRAA